MLIDLQTTKYRINELTEIMHDYISDYLKNGSSKTLKELSCLNLTKQQEREYKDSMPFHMPIDVYTFTDTDKIFLKMFSLENTKLTETQFENLAKIF